MKTIKKAVIAGLVSSATVLNLQAQQTPAIANSDHELSVLNQLGSSTAVVNMPVSQLLNAPGNEALRAYIRQADCSYLPCAGSPRICRHSQRTEADRLLEYTGGFKKCRRHCPRSTRSNGRQPDYQQASH